MGVRRWRLNRVPAAALVAHATAAGGLVRLSTPANAPIRQFVTQDYPYAGVPRVQGMSSALQMTVLSASQVQLDHAADRSAQ